MTQTEFAVRLQVSRQTVSELLHERRPLTPNMSIRLARLIGGTAGTWLKMQQAVDLWEVQHGSSRKHTGIKRIRQPKERKAG
jgi:antitoxin HigA-1